MVAILALGALGVGVAARGNVRVVWLLAIGHGCENRVRGKIGVCDGSGARERNGDGSGDGRVLCAGWRCLV